MTIIQGDAHVWNVFLPKAGGENLRLFDWDSWRVDVATDSAGTRAGRSRSKANSHRPRASTIRRRQLSEDGNVEISGRDVRRNRWEPSRRPSSVSNRPFPAGPPLGFRPSILTMRGDGHEPCRVRGDCDAATFGEKPPNPAELLTPLKYIKDMIFIH